MSLLPADVSTTRSPSSLATAAHPSSLPEVLPKSANIRTTRSTILDDDSQSKFYNRCPTTHPNNAWVRRFKSINESQVLSSFFRDQSFQDQFLLKKRPYQQLLSSSSSSSFISLNKHRREKCT